MHDLTIIIPAAGLGRRMKSYGPKALIELARGQTVIARQLSILKGAFPEADVVVVVGFEAERVCRHLPGWVRVVENEGFEFSNVARSIALGLRSSHCRAALVVYGDLVFNRETFRGLPLDRSWVLVDSPDGAGRGQFREGEVGCTVTGGVVAHFDYGLPLKWGQVALLTGRELHLFRRTVAGLERRRHFGFEILNEVIEHGGEFLALHQPAMRVVEIDSSADIEAARRVP